MQVENEVGVPRDTRDRFSSCQQRIAGQVPAELMNYLQSHKDTLIPEFREVWAANGYRKSGTWEEVFGPGKPATWRSRSDHRFILGSPNMKTVAASALGVG